MQSRVLAQKHEIVISPHFDRLSNNSCFCRCRRKRKTVSKWISLHLRVHFPLPFPHIHTLWCQTKATCTCCIVCARMPWTVFLANACNKPLLRNAPLCLLLSNETMHKIEYRKNKQLQLTLNEQHPGITTLRSV